MANEITEKKRSILMRVLGGIGKAGKTAIKYSPVGAAYSYGKLLGAQEKQRFSEWDLEDLQNKQAEQLWRKQEGGKGNMPQDVRKAMLELIKAGKYKRN